MASSTSKVWYPKFPLILVVVETQCCVDNPVIRTDLIFCSFKYISSPVPIKALFTFLEKTIEAGIPSAYTRQLSPRKRSESEYVGALSLGDSYRPTDDLQIQYGVRLDGNRFTSEPMLNPRCRAAVRRRERPRAESPLRSARASASRGCTVRRADRRL